MTAFCRRTIWDNAGLVLRRRTSTYAVVGLSRSLGSSLKVFEHVHKQATTTYDWILVVRRRRTRSRLSVVDLFWVRRDRGLTDNLTAGSLKLTEEQQYVGVHLWLKNLFSASHHSMGHAECWASVSTIVKSRECGSTKTFLKKGLALISQSDLIPTDNCAVRPPWLISLVYNIAIECTLIYIRHMRNGCSNPSSVVLEHTDDLKLKASVPMPNMYKITFAFLCLPILQVLFEA